MFSLDTRALAMLIEMFNHKINKNLKWNCQVYERSSIELTESNELVVAKNLTILQLCI